MMQPQLKSTLPPLAQARAQEWFDVASTVVVVKGGITPKGKRCRVASAKWPNFWEYEDERVKIEKWGAYDMLSIAVRDNPGKSLLLMVVNNGKVHAWAPEEDILTHLKSLVVLELLAGQ
jgi:hypothetical protein